MATVRSIDGQIVLEDPQALAAAVAVAKHNCRSTFARNIDRITHFKGRMQARGLGPNEAVIVVLNVDDPHGGPIADLLMPGQNWDEYRARGETPYARGLAVRSPIQAALQIFDRAAALKLESTHSVAVVVVDHGVAEVFPV